MHDFPPNYETKNSDYRRRNSRPPGPCFNRQGSLGPTHTEPHTHKPKKLPCPKIERPHLVQRNPRWNESHHEVVFGATEAELCQHPEGEGCPQDRFPANSPRQQNCNRCEQQEDDVHGQDIEQRWPINEESSSRDRSFSASHEVEIQKIVESWPVAMGCNGHCN